MQFLRIHSENQLEFCIRYEKTHSLVVDLELDLSHTSMKILSYSLVVLPNERM